MAEGAGDRESRRARRRRALREERRGHREAALQFSLAHPDITTTVAGSANPANIRQWAQWAAEPLDQKLLAEVQEIFKPVKNLGHMEGLPENN